MSKSFKIIHIVDFVNKNLWFEEYLDLISAQGVEQEILMLSHNEHLLNFTKTRNMIARGSFEFLFTSFFNFTGKDKVSFALAHGYVPSVFTTLMSPLHRTKLMIVHHHQPNFFKLYRSKSLFKGTLHGFLLRFTYKKSFAIQSFSEEVQESLLLKGVSNDKIFSNPIGVNLTKLREFLALSNNVHSPENLEKVAVSVSRLSWEKNLTLGIKAVVKARQGGSRLRYHIYGEGPERSALQALIAKLDANDYVELKGFDSEVFRALASADLFLHTSQTESYGQVIFEAYSIGVPILSSKVGVAIDLNRIDFNQVQLIKSHEPTALANQICAVLQNRQVNNRVTGHPSTLEQHSIERSVSSLVKFLQTCL
jgi:glycosyltransferase involved in cell wall biosynthesis